MHYEKYLGNMNITIFNKSGLIRQFSASLLLLFVIGCGVSQKPRVVKLEAVSFEEVDGWQDDTHLTALHAFSRSCEKILNIDVERNISKATDLGGSAIDWQVPCMEAVMQTDYSDDTSARKFFEKWFTPYRVYDEDRNPEGTLTGYFQIELDGSKKKTLKYKYPVYRKPKNLEDIKGTQEIEHAAINDGALAGKGLEVAYVDNKARLYFMQIQGSGIIRLKDGNIINLGFEDHNGFRFRGISEALRDNDLKFNSADGMMNWLHKNPNYAKKIMESDPSYVFFKPIEGDQPVGGQGVNLKSERSLAVDYGLYPYGTPVWVATKLPENSLFRGREYKRLFIAQDTGGAIRGAVRGDVFFGRGAKAEEVAGRFKAKGRFFVFFPKTVEVPESYISKF
jgi:membrane-bound lytic murein transglycosylase A